MTAVSTVATALFLNHCYVLTRCQRCGTTQWQDLSNLKRGVSKGCQSCSQPRQIPKWLERRLTAAKHPKAKLSPIYDKIRSMGIPVYESPEEFYAHHEAQLAVITASIPAHCPMTILALEHGSNVLCEKPAASTVEDVRAMQEASERSGKFVAINFNRCFAPGAVRAKQDYLSGDFGKPLRLRIRSICGRDDSYFFRNNWSCRIRDTNGNIVLDSVICNGTSHELQNAYFMHGPAMDVSAKPVSLRADLLRANPIETYDTCILEAKTDIGAKVLCYVTHATDYTEFPVYDYEYENAFLHYDRTKWGDDLIAELNDGSIRHYGPVFPDGTQTMKLCAQAITKNEKPVCGLEASISHVLTVDALSDLCKVYDFPISAIVRDDAKKCSYVPGLGEEIIRCYNDGCLLSDRGLYGLGKTEMISLEGYISYRG